MIKILQMLILGLFTVFCFTVHAGSSSGPITQVSVVGDAVLFTAGTHVNKPACSTIGDDWSISLATPGGRAMYALVLSAQAQRLSIYASGYVPGNCSAWGDRETPSVIQVYP